MKDLGVVMELLETKETGIEKISRGVSRGVVTERDAGALRWVCEQGAMSVDQLWRAVWSCDGASQSPRYAYERVRFLEQSGFLEGVRINHSLKTYFRATRKAVEVVSAHAQVGRLIPTARTPTNEIPHVDVLTEVRLAAQRAGKVSDWLTDRMLILDPKFPRDRFAVPDAIWVTKGTGRKIAVEHERTRKKRTRVKDKADLLARELTRADRMVELVLWIAAPGLYRELEMVLSGYPNQRLRTLDQFLSELPGSSGDGRGAV
ncbi:hypothetical protein WDW86_10945 [Bdellovibrionota bacterium FG-2]